MSLWRNLKPGGILELFHQHILLRSALGTLLRRLHQRDVYPQDIHMTVFAVHRYISCIPIPERICTKSKAESFFLLAHIDSPYTGASP